MAYGLQGMTVSNPRTTVTSIGVSAYDMISQRAMMEELCQFDGGLAIVPFVSYGSPSEYLWADRGCGAPSHRMREESKETHDAVALQLVSTKRWRR